MCRATDVTSTSRTNGDDDDGQRRGSDGGKAMPTTTSLARRCDAGGGGGTADGARVEEGPTGEIPARRMERPARHGGVPAKQRSSRRRGRRCDVDGGDGDVGRRAGDEQQLAGDGKVLDTDKETAPASFGRGGGEAGEEGGVAEPRDAMARLTDAHARLHRQLEAAGTGEREGRRRGGSNSGRDIEYASGLLPNGSGLTPPLIGYHAPKTSSILQGLIREPADTGKKRKIKALTIDPSALAPKKKTRKNKPKPTDDLPALDPSIEHALDEEDIEEDVDQAAAKALADLFSFDIRDYFDQTEEDTTSKALAPLSDDVKKTLEDISLRLEASSLDSLVVVCGSIRTRLHEVQGLILEELANVLTLAAYLEQHQFKLEKAKLRLAERRERWDIEATIQANR
uniref:DUF1409 domain-containing protein n=1 Tax=Oryza sativa subsp. japonica TaxID=39947 RepID=Q2QS88_ORYSJ|nr:hypothetical protein LOC_Os12g24960 [Oryza sativa Japonica Group]